MQADPRVPHSSFRRALPKRIAWITPDYPPDRGGVSDHSSAMVSELRSAGHEVLICSRPHERGFGALDAELAAYCPELVVVAYTPLAYAPRTFGIAPAFTRWSVGLRRRLRCHAVLLAHEASLPVTFHLQRREFKLASLAAIQVAQFFHSHRDFRRRPVLEFGYPTYLGAALVTFGQSVSHDSYLLEYPLPFQLRAECRPDGNRFLRAKSDGAVFRNRHDSVLFDYLEEAFVALLETDPSVSLVVVGMSPEKLRRLRPSLADLGGRVRALGYVAAEQVSLWLQVATLVLAPLIEGVSARKGTVMAALQHGRTVVTTQGIRTLEDIAWNEICLLTPLDRKAFAAMAVKAFLDPKLRAVIGRAAQAEYEAHASASVTASMILDYADQFGGEGAAR